MALKVKQDDIEFALQMLNAPDRESNTAFREWIAEPDHRELFRQMLALREAGMHQWGGPEEDVDRMWQQFDRKVHRRVRRRIWTSTASVAAVLAVVFGLYGLLRKQEVATTSMLAQVEYNLGKGVTLVAETSDQPVKKTLSQEEKILPGVKTFVRDSLRGISYSDLVAAEDDEAKYHTLRVPRGADYMVVLEDSTCVWMNAESELHYPASFGTGERRVELKGEAYFKVRPDASRPFIVSTERAETRVLGTEFNMQAYPGRTLNVTLVKGSVGVRAGAAETLLLPGENAVLTDAGLKVEKVDVLKYTSWKNGFFYYDNDRLENLLEDLGRWYDLPVQYEEKALKELRFKFWAGRYEPLESTLRHLNEMQKVRVEAQGQYIVVSVWQEESILR